MSPELQHDDYPREQYQTIAPIGATSPALAASIALGRLFRLTPYADVTSLRFEIQDPPDHPYAGPGPYVVCKATEPDECPSCHTQAGHHPHTEYCRRLLEYPGQPDHDPWLGHRDLCPIQWGEACDCHDDPVTEVQLHTPAEWAKLEDCLILDPDGWRGRNAKDFNEPITQAEYERRRTLSTCRFGSQVSQPASRTSQPSTQVRVDRSVHIAGGPNCPTGCPWHGSPDR